jgi:hypothetical protein
VALSATVNPLPLREVAASPELVHILTAAYSCAAVSEVLGTVVPVEASRKLPTPEPVQEFPVPLVPPEVALTIVILVKGAKVA